MASPRRPAQRGRVARSGSRPARRAHRPRPIVRPPIDGLPDARDGLTRLERIILWQLREAQRETGRESIKAAMLYGRVVEHINISVEEFQTVLIRLVGRGL